MKATVPVAPRNPSSASQGRLTQWVAVISSSPIMAKVRKDFPTVISARREPLSAKLIWPAARAARLAWARRREVPGSRGGSVGSRGHPAIIAARHWRGWPSSDVQCLLGGAAVGAATVVFRAMRRWRNLWPVPNEFRPIDKPFSP
jgi:hypothetical protein